MVTSGRRVGSLTTYSGFDTRVGVVNILVLEEQLVSSDHPTVEFFFCLARSACDSVQFPLEIDGFFFV